MEPIDGNRRLGPDVLAIFVVGPGLGEGIAVALPGGGWILIDGCRTKGLPGEDTPLLSIWQAWRRDEDDLVRWMVLTHPHADHAAGFAAVLDAVDPGHVGLAGPPAPGRGLHAELTDWLSSQATTEDALAGNQLLAAANAIRSWERRRGATVTPLHDGVSLLTSRAVATVLSPTSSTAARLSALGWPVVRPHSNLLSVVIEITFGSTSVLLTGDLPHRIGNSVSPDGSMRLFRDYPQLGGHRGLKVPPDAEDITPPDVAAALAPVWLAVFDDNDQLLHEAYGEVALLVTAEATA